MQNTPSNFSLTHRQFQFLAGAACAGKTATASVFKIEAGGALTEDEHRELLEKKYVDAGGQPVKALSNILNILTTSDSNAYLGYEGSRLILSAVVYHAGDKSVLVQEIPNGVNLLSPVPERTVLDLLGHHVGVAPFRSIILDATLGEADALVLAALIDLRRRELLGALLDRQSEAAGSMPRSAIVDWVATKEPGAQWLISRLCQFFAKENAPSVAEVQSGIDRCVAEGYATVPAKGMICATEKIDSTARQLVLLSNRILLSATSLAANGENSITLSLEVLQSGLSGLLLLDRTGPGRIRLAGVSAQLVLALASQLFANPSHLRDLAPKSFTAEDDKTASETKTATALCPACGGVNPAGSKFCCHCGQTMGCHCAKCGAVVQANHRFCAICGTRQDGGK